MLRHQAALVSGKLTRVTSGVNLPPLEVIMSRCLSISSLAKTICKQYNEPQLFFPPRDTGGLS